MTTKHDLVEIFKDLDSKKGPPPSEYQAKLSDFVEAIKAGIPEIDGEVRRAKTTADVWNVILWPKYRREEAVYFVTVSQRGDKAIIHDNEQLPLTSPNELWAYLVRFSNDPTFQSSLLEMKNRNLEPETGILRTHSSKDISPADVAVEVAPDTVKAIYHREMGPFTVKLMVPPPIGAFKVRNRYKYLTVAGLQVSIDKVKEVPTEPDTLQIFGTVVPIAAGPMGESAP